MRDSFVSATISNVFGWKWIPQIQVASSLRQRCRESPEAIAELFTLDVKPRDAAF
jgi:hypothetical protein